MQLQFHKNTVSCLQKIRGDVQYQEQSQELRLPEGMADIGTILGAWGQVLIRSKEWRNGSMNVTGGVMAWAMYLPEEGEPQMVEAWIPFQMKWDLPQTQYDGVIRVSPLLKSVDARVTSARKLMIRACVGILAEATVPMETEYYTPTEIPQDIQLLERTYPMLLAKEAGEKAFTIEEDLEFPASAPAMGKLLRFSLQPELIDQKVLSSKVVFRGVCLAKILYMGEDGKLHSWSFEIPFSQYDELEADYDKESTAGVWMAVTALEMDELPEGGLHLKAGLTGQYMICDREMIRVVEDAYSTSHKTDFQVQQLQLPAILDTQSQLIRAEGAGVRPDMRCVDAVFYPDQVRMHREGDGISGELNGYFQILGYDVDGRPVATQSKWNGNVSMVLSENADVQIHLQPSGATQMSGVGDEPGADMLLHAVAIGMDMIPMITAVNVEGREPDPYRPSLILRRAGREDLWQLAKESGSTRQMIRQANGLGEEPELGQMLLIPVP